MIYNDEGSALYTNFIIARIKENLPKQKLRILNAGCGNNWMKKCVPKGIDLVGLDINNPSADVNADLEKRLPFKSGEFDAVLLVHVIEHLKDPLFALKELARVTKKGGVLFISTPSPWSANAWEDPYHVRPFTKGSLKTLADDAGYDAIEVYYTNTTPGFGILRINRLERFTLWFTNIRFLNVIDYFKGNAEAFLRKR